MKLQIASDLHLEYRSGNKLDALYEILQPQPGVDVLVLAGDICNLSDIESVYAIADMLPLYQHVIWVPGNNEYRGMYPDEANQVLINFKRSSMRKNLHILINGGIAEIDGQRFLGGTMWFRYQVSLLTHRTLDYTQIKDFEPWVYNEANRFRYWLEGTLRKDDIVITHHLPSYKSVAPQFVGSPRNACFVHEMDQLIEAVQPKMWIHGHSHAPVDYSIGETRIVSNPAGYPSEQLREYQEPLVIEV